MNYMKLNIQLFSDGKVVIDTELNTKDFEKGLDQIKNSSKNTGTSIKNIVAGLGITKLISVAMKQISNSLDSAISRFDTLNNFPKVMSNLNIGAQESQKAIDKMSDALVGLPTTLDQGAAAVQRFTSKNNDVAKSTDLFLALNNAILAGGASSDIQSSALEQLSQSYAKGKPDMMEWRTAMMAMPAQLKQVAIAMGYVDADALGEALRSGTISMDEFMDTIVRLNTEGANGFKSFDEQARNSTDGIKTSITNMRSRITQGVTAVIEAINQGLKENNMGSLADVFAKTGDVIRDTLKKIAEYIPSIIGFLKKIAPLLPPIVAAIGAFIAASSIINLIQGITTAMAALNAVLLANPIALIAAAIAVLVVGFVTLWKKSEAFRNFWIGLWDTLKKTFEPVVKSLVEMFKSAWDLIKVVWDNVKPYFEVMFSGLKILFEVWKKVATTTFETAWVIIKGIWSVVGEYFKTIFNVLSGIFSAIKNVLTGNFKGAWEDIKGIFANVGSYFKNVVNIILSVFANIGSSFLSVGKNIVTGIWNGISNAKDWLLGKVKSFASGILKGMKNALGIHSPSRVFRDEVGKMIAQGVGVGFNDELDHVYKEMQDAIDLETAKMSANVQTSGTYQMAMNGTPTFMLKDNSTNQTQLVVNGKVLAEVVNTENRNREVAKA